ncbi:TRAP transporter small permease subunit, partial [Succinatimonas hippei]
FIYSKFTGKKRVFLDILSEILVILTAILLLIYGGYVMAAENMNQVTASLGVNMGLMYAVLPISGILITVYGLLNLAKMFSMLKDPNVGQYGVGDEDNA